MVDTAPDNPGVIAPPPLIALATVVVGVALDWVFPVYVLDVLFLFWTRVTIGLILIAAGVALAIAARQTFLRIGTNVQPWKPSLRLASIGVYTYLRNPMYVGLALIVAGIAIALASDWTLVLLIPAALVMHYRVVLREERYLEEKFGDAYRRYKQIVPRYGWPG